MGWNIEATSWKVLKNFMSNSRSDNCIKNYYYSTLRKHIRRINKSLKQQLVGRFSSNIIFFSQEVRCKGQDSNSRTIVPDDQRRKSYIWLSKTDWAEKIYWPWVYNEAYLQPRRSLGARRRKITHRRWGSAERDWLLKVISELILFY